mgnify:CR=1 FL=1
MSQPTYILGGYQTDFATAWSRQGLDISDMMREATLGALDAAAIDASAIESIHVGNAFGELQRQQAHLGAMVAQVVRLRVLVAGHPGSHGRDRGRPL